MRTPETGRQVQANELRLVEDEFQVSKPLHLKVQTFFELQVNAGFPVRNAL